MKDANPNSQKWKETLEEWTPDIEIAGWEHVSDKIPRGSFQSFRGLAQRMLVKLIGPRLKPFLLNVVKLVVLAVAIPGDTLSWVHLSDEKACCVSVDTTAAIHAAKYGCAERAVIPVSIGNQSKDMSSSALKVLERKEPEQVNHKRKKKTQQGIGRIRGEKFISRNQQTEKRGRYGKDSGILQSAVVDTSGRAFGRSLGDPQNNYTAVYRKAIQSDPKDSVTSAYISSSRVGVVVPSIQYMPGAPLPACTRGFLFWWKVTSYLGGNVSIQKSVLESEQFIFLSGDIFKEYRYLNRIGLRFDAGFRVARKSEPFLDTIGRIDTLIRQRTVHIGYGFAGVDLTARLFETYKARVDVGCGVRMNFFQRNSSNDFISGLGFNPVGAVCFSSRYKIKRQHYSPTLGFNMEYTTRNVSEIGRNNLLIGISLGVEL